MMNKIQVLVVVLLIIAIVFSAVSIALNFSLAKIEPGIGNSAAQSSSGNIKLGILENPLNTGGGQ